MLPQINKYSKNCQRECCRMLWQRIFMPFKDDTREHFLITTIGVGKWLRSGERASSATGTLVNLHLIWLIKRIVFYDCVEEIRTSNYAQSIKQGKRQHASELNVELTLRRRSTSISAEHNLFACESCKVKRQGILFNLEYSLRKSINMMKKNKNNEINLLNSCALCIHL